MPRYDSRSRSRGRSRGGKGTGFYGENRYAGDRNLGGQSVLVKNLNYKTEATHLRSHFEKFGSLKDVYIPTDFYTRQPKGFGFVEFYESKDASKAVQDMDGANVDGNNLIVCIAQNRRRSPNAMRQREHPIRRRSPSPYDRRRGNGPSSSHIRRRDSRSPSRDRRRDCSPSRRRSPSLRSSRSRDRRR